MRFTLLAFQSIHVSDQSTCTVNRSTLMSPLLAQRLEQPILFANAVAAVFQSLLAGQQDAYWQETHYDTSGSY
jgi:hypothetical protein